MVIPLIKDARIIIDEGGLPYPISAQKFNEHIKAVCRLAGINKKIQGKRYDNDLKRTVEGVYPKFELITSHVCRRSFASNFHGRIETSVLMRITGHSTERMFYRYIGKSPEEHVRQMAEVFYEKSLIP